MLVRTDAKWIRLLSRMIEAFEGSQRAKPDTARAENMRFLNEMYKSQGEG